MWTETDETVTVDEPIEWTDRSLPTACNWVKYEIQPGTYAIRLWFDMPRAVVQAREIESYYVNRLFTASSVNHKTEPGPIHERSVPAHAVGYDK